jgi:hypothetical protein
VDVFTKEVSRGNWVYFETCVDLGTQVRSKRRKPTATEIGRIDKILQREPALKHHRGERIPVEKRTGEVVYFSSAALKVAQALMAKKLNPERAHVAVVLRTAAEVC